MDVSKVTRLELIDGTKCKHCKGEAWIKIEGQPKPLECPACHGLGSAGRSVIFWDASKQIELSLQDDGRTLKVFVDGRDK